MIGLIKKSAEFTLKHLCLVNIYVFFSTIESLLAIIHNAQQLI